jgi:hypothetical protein
MASFYDYENARSLFRKLLAEDPTHDIFIAAKENTLDDFYAWLWRFIPEVLRNPQLKGTKEETFMLNMMARLQAELPWLDCERPYVNVYPVMEGIIDRVKLDLQWDEVVWPFKVLLFRFAQNEAEWGWEAALVSCYDDTIQPSDLERDKVNKLEHFPFQFAKRGKRWIMGWIRPTSRPVEQWDIPILAAPGESTVQETIDRLEADQGSKENAIMARLAKLAVFTALVWQDNELVTRHISEALASKMQSRTQADQESLLRKQAKQTGWGYDLGKQLQSEKNITPHWRMPHYALYHTGAGGKVPKMLKRRGTTIKIKHGMEVPTGFIGPETEGETRLSGFVFARQPMSVSMRFEVMRRDNYRCCLCGKSAEDGTRLEIDHKVPVAKGGETTTENLWVLCFDCNRGKGTNDL